jgi:hypothetical protein
MFLSFFLSFFFFLYDNTKTFIHLH